MKNFLTLSSLLMASLTFPLQSVSACGQEDAKGQARYIKKERTKRIKVTGIMTVESSFAIERTEGMAEGETFEETWHIARIETNDDSVYSTYHNTDNLIILCGRAQGPVRDAQGVFYLQENPEDGNFYVFDWEGTYLPIGTEDK